MLGHKIQLDPYADGDSVLHRWDPRLKIIVAFCIMATVTFLRSLSALTVAMTFVFTLLILSRLPAKFVLGRLSRLNSFLLPFLLIFPVLSEGHPLVTFGPISIKDKGVELGLLMYGKGLAIVVLAMVVLNTARLTDTLWAMECLGVPKALRQLAMLTVRYLPIIHEELNAVRKSAACRGFKTAFNRRSAGVSAAMAAGIIGRSLRRSERIWNSMLCRGFQGEFYTVRKWRARAADWLGLAAGIAFSGSIVFLDVLFYE